MIENVNFLSTRTRENIAGPDDNLRVTVTQQVGDNRYAERRRISIGLTVRATLNIDVGSSVGAEGACGSICAVGRGGMAS